MRFKNEILEHQDSFYDQIILFVEKYGLLLVFAWCYGLFEPQLSSNTSLADFEHGNAAASSASNIAKQLFWSGLFSVYFLCMIRETVRFNPLRERWALIIILVSSTSILFLSALWSDAPSYTIKRSLFQLLLMFDIFCAVFFSMKHSTFSYNVRIFGVLMIVFTLISIATGSGFSELGLSAYTTHKNAFGAFIISFFIFYSCIKPRGTDIFIITLLIVFLVLSLSKTSMALLLLVFILAKLHAAFSKVVFSSLYYIMTSIFLLIPMFATFMGILWYPSQDQSPLFMTGRGIIWQTLYPDILKIPDLFYGHGYGAFFGTGKVPDALNIKLSFLRTLNQSHNGFLDLALQIGFPLTVLLVSLIFTLARRLDLKNLYMAGIVLFIYSVSEAPIYRDQQPIWITFLIILSWALVEASKPKFDVVKYTNSAKSSK